MYQGIKLSRLAMLLAAAPVLLSAHEGRHDWQPVEHAPARIHAPTPVPDRIILTGNGDPTTTQAVTWRTDISVLQKRDGQPNRLIELLPPENRREQN